jgi:hypothetical protein
LPTLAAAAGAKTPAAGRGRGRPRKAATSTSGGRKTRRTEPRRARPGPGYRQDPTGADFSLPRTAWLTAETN